MAYNICCSTLIQPEVKEYIHSADMHTSPDNVSFIKSKRKKGLFPILVEELIQERNKVKEDILKCNNTLIKKSLKSRESAIKKLTNAI